MGQTIDLTSILIAVSIAAVAAAMVLAYFLSKASSQMRELSSSHEREKDRLNEKLTDALKDNAALQSRLDARYEYETAQNEQHAKDLETMKDAFKALSAENSSEFRKQSAESISELLKPIQEKFSEFDRTVRETQKENAAQSAAMKENIENVMKHSQAVGDEARNLANALTGYSKIQGDFGEMLLTDVLRNAGLTEGIHFVTQSVMTNKDGHEIKSESGGTMIPDVMVFYPDETTVIVDSKVSLNAYQEYMNTESIEERRRLAKAHVESVRNHVNELKDKDYASYLPEGKSKVKYNIMFIPIEGAFRLMLEEDPRLWQVSKDNNVLIVSQMTLIIVLNMIQMAWKQANQEKNIAEVYKTADDLMGQIGGWLDSFARVGKSLEDAGKAYSEARNKLTDNNQSVIKKIQKLENLGLSPKKTKKKIKTNTRLNGPESIIPQAFLPEGSE